MGNSLKTIMVMGILTTIFLLCMSLFTLQHNPHLKELMDMSDQIKFDTKATFVSVNKNNQNELIHYKILVVVREMPNIDPNEKVNQIGEYVWLKFAKEKKINTLEIIYDVESGSGCTQESLVHIQKEIKKPK